MIEVIEDMPNGTVGFSFSGEISGSDYESILTPAVDQAISQFDHIKGLLSFGEDFECYSIEAAWDDTRLGLRHWSGFERLAIVTNVPWLRQGVHALAMLLPYPVRLFANDDSENARRWLSEDIGTIHLEQDGELIKVKLIGQVNPTAYERIEDAIANLFSHSQEKRLLLDLSNFDGWMGISALGNHLALISEFRQIPKRVAVVGDQRWQQLHQRLIGKMVRAEIRYFDSSELPQAEEWIGTDS